MRDRLVFVAMALVVALTSAACGEGSAGSESSVGGPTRAFDVPVGLGTAGTIAAGDDWLVGVVAEPFSIEKPSTVAAIHLASEKVTTVSGPLDQQGTPVALSGLVADGDRFVGVGDLCVPPGGGEGCQGDRVLVEFDPAAETWTVNKFPIPIVGPVDGAFFVDSDLVLVESDGRRVRVARQGSEGWRSVAEMDTAARTLPCVGGGSLWLFVRTSGDGNVDGENEVTALDTAYSLTRVDLEGGGTESVDLPEIASYFGGVTTSFGCDGLGPVVATTPPGEVPSPESDRSEMEAALTGLQVFSLADDGWRQDRVNAISGATVSDQIVSGERALLLAAELDRSGTNHPIAVVLGESTGEEVPRDGTDTYLWRGTGSDLIRIFDAGNRRKAELIEVGS